MTQSLYCCFHLTPLVERADNYTANIYAVGWPRGGRSQTVKLEI